MVILLGLTFFLRQYHSYVQRHAVYGDGEEKKILCSVP